MWIEILVRILSRLYYYQLLTCAKKSILKEWNHYKKFSKGWDKMTNKKFGIKEAWLLNEKGEKIMKLGECSFETPLDKNEIVYENGVAILKPKDKTDEKKEQLNESL
jgi:hypothetical protein